MRTRGAKRRNAALRRVWTTERSRIDPTGENGWVLVKGRSGLGNRILAVLTGLLYARRAGRRLVVDWRDSTYSNDRTNAFDKLFQLAACDSVDEVPVTDSVRPGVWLGHLDEPFERLWQQQRDMPYLDWARMSSLVLTEVDYEETVLVVTTSSAKIALMRSPLAAVVQELWPSSSTDVVLSRLLASDLQLHPDIRARVDELVENQLSPQTVGVHVRYTDRKTRLQAILRKVDAAVERQPLTQVFLATDSAGVRDLFEQRYKNLLALPHRYAETEKQLHGQADSPDRHLDAVEALVDMYLLAECNHLVIDTSSSFSYLAKLLSRCPRSRVDDLNPFKPRFRELVKRLMPPSIRWGI